MGEYGDLGQNEKKLNDKYEKTKNNVNSKDSSKQNNKAKDVCKEEEFEPSDEYENNNAVFDDNFEPISEEDEFNGSIKNKFELYEEREIIEKNVDLNNNNKQYDDRMIKESHLIHNDLFSTRNTKLATKNIIKSKDFNKEEIIHFKENLQLSEMIGIILGDGNFYSGEGVYRLRISLNKIENNEYRKYVKGLMENIFKITPKSYNRKNKKGVDLQIQNKAIIKGLIEKGIKARR